MYRSGAAERHQRKVSRIKSPFKEDHAQRGDHAAALGHGTLDAVVLDAKLAGNPAFADALKSSNTPVIVVSPLGVEPQTSFASSVRKRIVSSRF